MFWLFLAVLLWGFLHSLLASLKLKALIQRWSGRQPARFYRLAYNLLAGMSFLPVLVIAAVTPDRRLYTVPLPWSVLMVFGEFLAVVLLMVAFQQTDVWEFLGLRQVMGSASGSEPEGPLETMQVHLVTTGIYRYIRHPLYTAGLVFIWLLPVMTVNILVINIALTIYIVIGAYIEERKLLGEFGQEYRDYAAVTPMFIPFLKGNKTPP